jgi:hypothetical protein
MIIRIAYYWCTPLDGSNLLKRKMALVNLTPEQRKLILKCYWKIENVEYPPRSPDLTPLDFFLWAALNNAVYTSTPRTLQDLRRETETACSAVTLATIQNICQSVARCCQQCIAAGGGHFEHL